MATKALLRRLLLVLTLSEEGLADPWFKASACEGLRFTPLTRSPDILAVAERAENCMDWLYERLVRNQARFFSVQDAVGDDVAYVEVMAHASAQGAISISQVKGPRNAAVAPSIAKIAHRWLAERVKLDGLPRIAPGDLREIPPGRWAALLGPAIASAPAGSALADAPTIVQLRAIEDEITALSAHLRVAGWNKL